MRRVIRGFLGQPGPGEGAGEKAAEVATETARATDRLRAIQYYEGLIMDAARTGEEEFEITREVYDSAPKDRTGAPIDILVVGCYLADQLGYVVVDQEGRQISVHSVQDEFADHDEDEDPDFINSVLPLTIECWTPGYRNGFRACKPCSIENIEKIRQGKALAPQKPVTTTSSLQAVPSRENLSDFEKCFVAAVDAACSNAQRALQDLARAAFSQGRFEFVVDEEVWSGVAAKFQLADEKAPPLFKEDVKRLAGEDESKKNVVVTLLPSVAQRLAFQTDGLCVTPTLAPADFDPNNVADRLRKLGGKLYPRLPLRLRPKFGQPATSELKATRFRI